MYGLSVWDRAHQRMYIERKYVRSSKSAKKHDNIRKNWHKLKLVSECDKRTQYKFIDYIGRVRQ